MASSSDSCEMKRHMATRQTSDLPISCAVAQESTKLWGISVFKEQHQEALTEFKGAWKLAKNLPHTVQEEQEDRRLLARFAVGVGWLGAALLEWVTRLGRGFKEVKRVMRRGQITFNVPLMLYNECYQKGEKEKGWAVLKKITGAHLEPFSLHQALEASDGPAGRIKDDLSQGGHLQGGVCPFCTVNKHRCSLPDTNIHAYCLSQEYHKRF